MAKQCRVADAKLSKKRFFILLFLKNWSKSGDETNNCCKNSILRRKIDSKRTIKLLRSCWKKTKEEKNVSKLQELVIGQKIGSSSHIFKNIQMVDLLRH